MYIKVSVLMDLVDNYNDYNLYLPNKYIHDTYLVK